MPLYMLQGEEASQNSLTPAYPLHDLNQRLEDLHETKDRPDRLCYGFPLSHCAGVQWGHLRLFPHAGSEK